MTPPRRPFSDHDAEAVIRLHGQGLPAAEIARQIGRSRSVIENWLSANVPNALARRRQAIRDVLIAEPGLTLREVGRRVGCSPEMVKRVRDGNYRQPSASPCFTPPEWLEQPSGRIKAQRQAQGIEL